MNLQIWYTCFIHKVIQCCHMSCWCSVWGSIFLRSTMILLRIRCKPSDESLMRTCRLRHVMFVDVRPISRTIISAYTENRSGDRTRPCLTTCAIEIQSLKSLSILIGAVCIQYELPSNCRSLPSLSTIFKNLNNYGGFESFGFFKEVPDIFISSFQNLCIFRLFFLYTDEQKFVQLVVLSLCAPPMNEIWGYLAFCRIPDWTIPLLLDRIYSDCVVWNCWYFKAFPLFINITSLL